MVIQKCIGLFGAKKVEKYASLGNAYSGYEESRGVCIQPWNETRVPVHMYKAQHWPKIYMKKT